MSTTVNIVTKDETGKLMNTALTNANDTAADSDLSRFAVGIASLSDNTLAGIQKVVKKNIAVPTEIDGTDDGEYFYSNNYATTIVAQGGNDSVYLGGKSLANVVSLVSGNNKVTIYGSNHTIYGGSGNDSITLGGANSTVNLIDGDNYIYLSGSNHTIYGGSGSDTYYCNTTNPNYIVNFDTAKDFIYVYQMDSIAADVLDNDTTLHLPDNKTVTLKDISSGTINIYYADSLQGYYAIGDSDVLWYSTVPTADYPKKITQTCSIQGGYNVTLVGADNCTFNHSLSANESIFGWNDSDSVYFEEPTASLDNDNGILLTFADSSTLFLADYHIAPHFIEPPPETLTSNASADDIVIFKHKVVKTAKGKTTEIYPEHRTTFARIAAGGGADSLSFGEPLSGLSIAGGPGRDYIDMSLSGGNTYVYYSKEKYTVGDGSDTITNWTTNDTLVIPNGTAQVSMNADASNFILEIDSGSITFPDFTPGSSKVFLIDTDHPDGVEVTVPRLMLGTSGANVIENTLVTDNNNTADKVWTIDGDKGNDTITNSVNYVSINGGAGADVITNSGEFVTIYGGAGNDVISLTGSAGTVIEWANGDGKDSIYGFKDNDSIILKDVTEDKFTVSSGADGNCSIKASSTNYICLVKTDKDLPGTNLNLFIDSTDTKAAISEIPNP